MRINVTTAVGVIRPVGRQCRFSLGSLHSLAFSPEWLDAPVCQELQFPSKKPLVELSEFRQKANVVQYLVSVRVVPDEPDKFVNWTDLRMMI